MPPFNLIGLPVEIRLQLYHHIFTNAFMRLYQGNGPSQPSPIVEPAIIRTGRLIRKEAQGEYRTSLQCEQADLERAIRIKTTHVGSHQIDALEAYFDNLVDHPRVRCTHGRWSMVRIERERVRYFESGGVALRGNKGGVNG
jgi:hypothetical protein